MRDAEATELRPPMDDLPESMFLMTNTPTDRPSACALSHKTLTSPRGEDFEAVTGPVDAGLYVCARFGSSDIRRRPGCGKDAASCRPKNPTVAYPYLRTLPTAAYVLLT